MVTGVATVNFRINFQREFLEKLYFDGLQEIEFSKDLIAFSNSNRLDTSAEVHYVFVDEHQPVIIFLTLTITEREVITTSSFHNLKDLVSAIKCITGEAHFDMTKTIFVFTIQQLILFIKYCYSYQLTTPSNCETSMLREQPLEAENEQVDFR